MYYFFLFWQNCTFKHTECALFPYFGKLVYLIIERIANVVPCHFLVMDSVISGQNHKLWFTTPLDKSLVSLLFWIRGPVEWERGGAWDWSSHDFNLNIYLKGRESSKMTWKWLGQWVTKSPERLPGTTKKKKKKILISKHFPEIYLKGIFIIQPRDNSLYKYNETQAWHDPFKSEKNYHKLWWGQWPDQSYSSQKQ